MQATVKTLGLSQKAVENIAEINHLLQNEYYPSSMNCFLESDYAHKFFARLDAVALEASLLKEDVEIKPHLDSWQDEVRRRNALKPAMVDLMETVKEASEALYDAEKIIESARGAALRKEASKIDGDQEAVVDGQADEI